MKQLERENRELRRANEILKAAAAFFGAELDRRTEEMTAFIDEHRERFGVEPICACCRSPRRPTTPRRRGRPRRARCVTPSSARRSHASTGSNFGVYGAARSGRS